MDLRRAGRVIRTCTVLVLLAGSAASAENVKDLPKPTSYVSDFAGVLDDSTKQNMEQLCGEVARQANAQIAVVTIHSLGDASVEDFAADLEQKWGVGKKGSDRGVLMLFAMDDKKDRVEVGYGLEGQLNDAKVGDILRSERSLMQQGQYSAAIQGDLQQVANDIAADAGVTLIQPEHHTYHRESERRERNPIGTGLRIFFILLVLWLLFRRRRGGPGGYGGGGGGFLPGFFIGNMLGGSRGNWGGGGGGSGWGGGSDSGGSNDGGFGGFDGGSSGGGGASGDW